MKSSKLTRKLCLALALLLALTTVLASCAYVDPVLDKIGEIKDSILGSTTPEEPADDPVDDPADDPTDDPADVPSEKPAEKTREELWREQYECITVAEALALCENFVSAPSEAIYYIIATVKSVDDSTYGKLMIEDETGEIMVYGTYDLDDVRYDKLTDKPATGDVILIKGALQNYKGNTKEVQKAFLVDFYTPESQPEPELDVKPGDTITIAKALEIAGRTGEDRFYIDATVKTVTDARFGAMIITDSTGEISVYNSKNADGTVGYADMADKPYKGDSVRVYCTLQDFNGSKEISSAYIISFEHFELDSSYVSATVAEARAAAKGDKLKLSGIVGRITYATGMKPSGFILIDGSATIYVYGSDAAARVAVGNEVVIAGVKDYWILAEETAHAAKAGYVGCNQISEAMLVENDGQIHDFDTTAIATSTVKDILDTPVSTDISSVVYKVNALVKKVPGDGFVNYYFFDLDGETGTYTYTQCNGNDFSWLDAFDNKICTVYITALNAKSTANDCFWRLLPVSVAYENFEFDKNETEEFVVKYHGLTSLEPGYMPGASVEVATLIDSALLGFEGAEIRYSSSDDSVLTFVTEDGVTKLNTLSAGTVTVTVTGIYDGREFSAEMTVTVKATVAVESITVIEAIESAIDTEVIVKGKVGPSTTNQPSGFYLIDETGAITVRLTSADAVKTLTIGDEVIIKGTRKLSKDNTSGQIVIDNAEIVANYYGGGTYSTDSFITDATISDVTALANTPASTSNVYVLNVSITKNVTAYATTYAVSGYQLYSGGGSQYAWLDAFFAEGATSANVTVELAICNWNGKALKGCILAVITPEGKVYNTINFD